MFIAAGYVDFPLIAYHFKAKTLISDSVIPIFYAVAMATDAIAALIFGKMFDKADIKTLLASILLSAFFAPMVFMGGFNWALAGMVLWGIGMGAQESILKAEMIPSERRGTAFGSFNAAYGLFWFAGSALMGYLYDSSVKALIIFSVTTQLFAAVVIYYMIRKRAEKVQSGTEPCSAPVRLVAGMSFSLSLSIVEIAPVRSLFFCAP